MKFPYSRTAALPEFMAGKPLVPIALYHAGYEYTWPALVDSGATFSVLPYDMGRQLGFVWGEDAEPFPLGGIYTHMHAILVIVRGEIAGLPPTALGFAWVEKYSNDVRLILGQTNFFQRFRVSRSESDGFVVAASAAFRTLKRSLRTRQSNVATTGGTLWNICLPMEP